MPTSPVNRKPNLFVIGAMKSGTSSLHDYLGTHPGICMSALKEPSYFADPVELRKEWPPTADNPCAWDEAHYLRLFETDKNAVIFGESSVHYTRLPRFAGTVERIARHNPEARFIYVMRDPVERAISHYWENVQYLLEHRPMPQAIAEDQHYRDVSHYAMQLAPYLDRFGSDRVMTIVMEEMAADPVVVLQRVFVWLGLDPDFVPPDLTRRYVTPAEVHVWRDWPMLHRFRRSGLWRRVSPLVPDPLRRIARRGSAIGSRAEAEEWTEATADFLRPIQREQTRELSALLGRDFPDWTTLFDGAACP